MDRDGKASALRIGIDASPMAGSRGGIGWYTYHLLRAMLRLQEPIEFVGYVTPGTLSRLVLDLSDWPNNPSMRWVEVGAIALRWRGPQDQLDLYHGTRFKMQTAGRFGGVVTIYDLWLDRYPRYSRKLLGQRLSFWKTRRTARKARKVITISRHSADDIQELYGIPHEKIAVIPCGVSDDFHPDRDPVLLAQLRARLNLPAEQFILFVGGADPRKNHRVLLEALAERRELLEKRALVCLGDPHHAQGGIMANATRLQVADRVVCAGHVSVEELRTLYSCADLFVFPSLYEGFGMPVLEAMACGTPVITSNRTSLPEVAGDAAVLVDPDRTTELGNAMGRILKDAAFRNALVEKGLARAKEFTWANAARQTMAVYRELCQ